MDSHVIYKLAFARNPTSAAAQAAADVGLPKIARPVIQRVTGGILRGAKNVARRGGRKTYRKPRVRSALHRTPEQVAKEPWNRPQPPPLPSREMPMLGPEHFEEIPGLGRRILKDWWTIPAAGAGVYGLTQIPDMFGGGEGAGEVPMGYYSQAGAQSPAQGRYQQMMALARQYGYM